MLHLKQFFQIRHTIDNVFIFRFENLNFTNDYFS